MIITQCWFDDPVIKVGGTKIVASEKGQSIQWRRIKIRWRYIGLIHRFSAIAKASLNFQTWQDQVGY